MNTAAYNTSVSVFKAAVARYVKKLTEKVNSMSIKTEHFSSSELTLKDNTTFVFNGKDGLNSLTLHFPKGNFISSLLFNTSNNSEATINFPSNAIFMGSTKPRFYEKESWEIIIHNGVVACARLHNK